MNKKRETIRKPVDREASPSWDDQDRNLPPKKGQRDGYPSDEEDMILEKRDD